ncbi:hypothetical protein [Streptomyces pseudovenezuelae]|uniref:PRC-barrel domain-containing protein n=1 Tax=Streptomyces pseudovenezuelae TaxID=67350 RepID=A0ABT6LCQ0_9ACTN|nr:hypothetical protein [Streptomyces pseudovenezuelae]MDH6214086.1 hypothetical protein [Streptomyces pseudovenezuelae]
MKLSDLTSVKNTPVRTRDGERIGRVIAIHVARTRAKPIFVQVLVKRQKKVVPLAGAKIEQGALTLPYSANKISNGPTSSKTTLSTSEEMVALDYYGLGHKMVRQKKHPNASKARYRRRFQKTIQKPIYSEPKVFAILGHLIPDWDDPEPIEPSATDDPEPPEPSMIGD